MSAGGTASPASVEDEAASTVPPPAAASSLASSTADSAPSATAPSTAPSASSTTAALKPSVSLNFCISASARVPSPLSIACITTLNWIFASLKRLILRVASSSCFGSLDLCSTRISCSSESILDFMPSSCVTAFKNFLRSAISSDGNPSDTALVASASASARSCFSLASAPGNLASNSWSNSCSGVSSTSASSVVVSGSGAYCARVASGSARAAFTWSFDMFAIDASSTPSARKSATAWSAPRAPNAPPPAPKILPTPAPAIVPNAVAPSISV